MRGSDRERQEPLIMQSIAIQDQLGTDQHVVYQNDIEVRDDELNFSVSNQQRGSLGNSEAEQYRGSGRNSDSDQIDSSNRYKRNQGR